MLRFLMLSKLNFSKLFSLKTRGINYYRMIHSFFHFNFYINAYSKGLNNRERRDTSLRPFNIKNVDGTTVI